jgi:hypothetical protein
MKPLDEINCGSVFQFGNEWQMWFGYRGFSWRSSDEEPPHEKALLEWFAANLKEPVRCSRPWLYVFGSYDDALLAYMRFG